MRNTRWAVLVLVAFTACGPASTRDANQGTRPDREDSEPAPPRRQPPPSPPTDASPPPKPDHTDITPPDIQVEEEQDPPPDRDMDGVPDERDNCEREINPDQIDTDADGLGDACDPCPQDPGNDADRDQHCSDQDNCPSRPNRDQLDSDADGHGDVCDLDDDDDGIPDERDNCPLVANPSQTDANLDLIGDACAPGCRSAPYFGDAIIEDRDDLVTLANFRTITGSLIIDDTDLSDLDELSCLRRVSGDVLIRANASLIDLSGLRNLARIDGDLHVGGFIPGREFDHIDLLQFHSCWNTLAPGNDALESLDGLNGLALVGGDVSIYRNMSLTSLDGFAALESIGGSLIAIDTGITHTSPESFSDLREVGGDIVFSGNKRLVRMEGFEALEALGGDLGIGKLTRAPTLVHHCNYWRTFSSYDDCYHFGGGSDCDDFFLQIGNRALTHFSAFQNLALIEGLLTLQESSSLQVFSMPSLVSVGRIQIGHHIKRRVNLNPRSDESSRDYLWAQGNLALTTVEMPLLERAGNILLESNPSLDQLSMPALRRIEGNFTVGRSIVLAQCSNNYDCTLYPPVNLFNGPLSQPDFGGLEQIDGYTSLYGQGRWQDTFGNLTHVGSLSWSDSDQTTLSGFESLTTIDGRLSFPSNPNTTLISGFNALTTATHVTIGGAPMMLDGFCWEQLDRGVPALTSVDGFRSLQAIDSLTVIDAPLLSERALTDFITAIPASPEIANCTPWTWDCPVSPIGNGFEPWCR